jgi:hypothetical protein
MPAGGLAAAGEPLQVTIGTGMNPSTLVPMNTWQANGLVGHDIPLAAKP